eukprot:7563610-Lingulodinium_polyedra.AAC.1
MTELHMFGGNVGVDFLFGRVLSLINASRRLQQEALDEAGINPELVEEIRALSQEVAAAYNVEVMPPAGIGY